ncbi:MAG: metallophosphoesterase [Candidatus Delongbacteria bacterium]|nr:metallophosphoesterase [Candidatus Delongbacteria bacterium]
MLVQYGRSSRWILVAALFIIGCDQWFEYSPYECRLPEKYRNHIAKNLARLGQTPQTTVYPIRIALVSDNHTDYQALQHMIGTINQLKPDFTIIGGDLTDLGLQEEYIQSFDCFKKLTTPFFPVIGNHDYLSNGAAVFRSMYGPPNYTIDHHNIRFIFWDDIIWENDNQSPDFSWLDEQLSQGQEALYRIVIAHIPPSGDQMKDRYDSVYCQLMRKHDVAISIHGHNHYYRYSERYGDGVAYLIVPNIAKKTSVWLEIDSSGIRVIKEEL